MMKLLLPFLTVILVRITPRAAATDVLVVVGAAGEEAYAPQFRDWAERWRIAAEKGKANFEIIGPKPKRRLKRP